MTGQPWLNEMLFNSITYYCMYLTLFCFADKSAPFWLIRNVYYTN